MNSRFLTFSLSCFLTLLLAGCSLTVIPKQVHEKQASFDGNIQNSGIIARLPDGSWEVTPSFHERYRGLTASFGKRFNPPVQADDGIKLYDSGPNYAIDSQHMVYFNTMNQWRKAELPK